MKRTAALVSTAALTVLFFAGSAGPAAAGNSWTGTDSSGSISSTR
jgi:hypothetical protein